MSGTVSDNTSQSSGSVTAAAAGVSIVSSDPTLTEGLLWYNSTSNVLKVARNITAWSSGGNLNTGRHASVGSNGTQSACFVAGGQDSGGRSDSSETYDGSAWSAVGDIVGTSRVGTSNFGTTTAGVSATGLGTSPVNVTNEFNGTSWTDVSATLIQAGSNAGGCGTQTAGLKIGAYADPTFYDETEHYDGTSWAAGGLISANTAWAQGCGTQTSAIRGGGNVSGTPVNTGQTYNGTSWSTVGSLSTARSDQSAFGASDSDGNVNGGWNGSAYEASTEIWNGSSWAAGSNHLAIRGAMQGCGSSSSSGLAAGGHGSSNVTEEYSEVTTARTLSNS